MVLHCDYWMDGVFGANLRVRHLRSHMMKSVALIRLRPGIGTTRRAALEIMLST
jgi:hypothetical protein